jgi:ATP/maltotriose-dependent transcriptional regulator MalT
VARAIATLDKARDAARKASWPQASALFDEIDDAALTPEDLEAKADAFWWTSRIDESMIVRQKAYAGHVVAGAARRAGYIAWFLSVDYRLTGEASVSSGWLMRARRDLSNEPECIERGFVLLADAGDAHAAGDLDRAIAIAEQVIEMGKTLGEADLIAVGIVALGRFHIFDGRVELGTKLLDEAMATVIGGLTGPMVTGWIFCDVLGICFEIADLRRASEWSDAAARWYEKLPGISPFHGICRLHRVEVATLRGAWDEAESDARHVSIELGTIRPWFAAGAVYALGEISRRRGDLPIAEEEFTRAHGLGREPQPGLALTRLAQGNASAAAAGLKLSLTEGESNPLNRAGLLAAQVEVSLANDDVAAARTACAELDELSARWGSPLLQATAWTACAARRLAEGDAEGAAADAHRASRLLHDLRLPHEAALARLLLGIASRKAGDEERARLEITAAHGELERLGAKRDAHRAAELLGGVPEAPRGLSEREVEVLRLVAAGKTNREIAAEMVLSEHTVSRHLQNIFRKLGVSSRSAATAFAFENGLVKQSMV